MKMYRTTTGPIAIIGIGCRFPGGIKDTETFWHVLINGIDTITEGPPDRFDINAFYDPKSATPGKIITRCGGFIEAIDEFDANFFGIAPLEAESLDPQQRLLLETTWEALEDAGEPLESLAGSQTGVFVGMWTGDYENYMFGASPNVDLYMTTGSGRYSASGRISHLFDLQGPSMTVDTACSSSLVAVHLACQSLRLGESNLAVAGAVNLILQPAISIAYSKAGVLSPDGRCKFGDASANGYVRSEGCGMLVLKPLSDALAENDRVYAVILGSAVNHDGQESLFVAPNQKGQEAVLRQACRNAGVSPGQIHYVEAHGTGTAVGDPVELKALGTVLADSRAKDRPCIVGSIKTNIGHTEAASGVAGLIKAALCLKHRIIPPSLHFKEPNPTIPWQDLPLVVQQDLGPIPADSQPTLAGINSFGITGTNAHVVLQEAPKPSDVERSRGSGGEPSRASLLPLSARSGEALEAMGRVWRDFLSKDDDDAPLLEDICYTASVRRTHHDCRLAVVGRSRKELVERLDGFVRGESPSGLSHGQRVESRPNGPVFVFSGQGPQWFAMGRELLERQPVYRKMVERCAELLNSHPGDWSLLRELTADESKSRLDQTEIAQPAIFALQMGLASLWQSWGIEPGAVVGHSIGEVAAACFSGILSLEDGVRVVYHRGRLLQQATGKGRMAAVELSLEEAKAILAKYAGRLGVAAVNSPNSVTFSGDTAALEEVLESLKKRNLFFRMLAVNYAFHSHQIKPYQQEMTRSVEGINIRPARIPIISTVTGKVASCTDYDAAYWAQNIRRPVQFGGAVDNLVQRGHTTFLEISPHPVLSVSISECLAHRDQKGTVLASLRRSKNEEETMFEALGALYAQGHRVGWKGVHPQGGRCVRLPLYPWQRKRFWFKSPAVDAGGRTAIPSVRQNESLGHPLLGQHLQLSIHPGTHFWEQELNAASTPLLGDYRVGSRTLFPAAVFVGMALTAATELFEAGPQSLVNMAFEKPLILPDKKMLTVQIVLSPAASGTFSCQLLSRPGRSDDGNSLDSLSTSWTLHGEATIRLGRVDASLDMPVLLSPREALPRFGKTIKGEQYYKTMQNMGIQYASSFQSLEQIWIGESEALAKLRPLGRSKSMTDGLHPVPALLEACFQLLMTVAPNGQEYLLPAGFDRFQPALQFDVDFPKWCYVVPRGNDEDVYEHFKGDAFLLDEEGHSVAEIKGLLLKHLQREKYQEVSDWFYQIQWKALNNQDSRSAFQSLQKLPTPSQIAERVNTYANGARDTNGWRPPKEVLEGIEALSAAYIIQSFRRLGWTFRLSQRVSEKEIAIRLGVADRHRRLLGRLLGILDEEGVLNRIDSEWEVLRLPQMEDPHKRWASLLDKYPDYEAEMTLLGRCGDNLADVLQGASDPLQLLFPEGSLATAEKLYDDAPFSRDCNMMIRETVRAALAELPPGRTLKILEIGAGTGGTTRHVLPLLPTNRSEYVFTDVSSLFLSNAEQKFRTYPFVEYRLLDISSSPNEQNFKSEQFDLILASNVLHATPIIRQTLRHVRELIAPSGLLVLLEGTSPRRWVDLIFGLTEGWWLFSDKELRQSHPLLPPSKWLGLLKEVGFVDPVAIPVVSNPPISLYDQAVFIARGPDVVEKPDCKRATALLDQKSQQAQPPDVQRAWLVFADDGGVGEKSAGTLKATDGLCISVYKGEDYKALSKDRFRINPGRPEDFVRLLKEALPQDVQLSLHIVHFWALDAPLPDKIDLADLEKTLLQSCGSTLHLVQALANSGRSVVPFLWLVTQGAQPLERYADHKSTSPIISALQTPLWGLGRVIALEQPELRCTLVDLDPAESTDGLNWLIQKILEGSGEESGWFLEDQFAFRGGEPYVARLVEKGHMIRQTKTELRVPEYRPFKLGGVTRGVLEKLTLLPVARQTPGPGEVEIRVLATGLNFRDVLTALDMYPGDAGPLGLECAGRITAVGSGVEKFQVDDEVIAFAQGSFGSFVIVSTEYVVTKPEELSFEEAASIPIAFLTAHYTLKNLARIESGDRVLIHAAAGGVGLAAIQIAQHIGAEIFATAGNHDKRQFLRSLGIQHVMDSRSLDFADQVMEDTGGRGVNIVLNSLAGEFIPASLDVLADSGRFLEIGKTDVWTRSRVKEYRGDCSYFLFDLIETANIDPSGFHDTFSSLILEFKRGVLKPLPLQVFPIENTISVFRSMTQPEHIGKITISQQPQDSATSRESRALFSQEGAYLITGGLGGLGLLLARWMSENGAHFLVLVGRRGPSEEARHIISHLENRGVKILTLEGDISREEDVRGILMKMGEVMPPLKGVIHCAGVLDDGVLLQQDWNRFIAVMKAKIAGTLNLHRHTLGLPLDHFVLFSSWASVLGSPGQGNHTAANAFLDAFAHYRRVSGLPAISINWGPWAEVGAAAFNVSHGERLVSRGIGTFTPIQGLAALRVALEQESPQLAFMPFDVNLWRESYPAAAKKLLFEDLPLKTDSALETYPRQPGEQVDHIYKELLKANSEFQRRSLLESHVCEQVSKVLRLSESRIDKHKPFKSLGLDSLTGLELCNRLRASLQISLPATSVWNYPTIAKLVDHLNERVKISSMERSTSLTDREAKLAVTPGQSEMIEGILDELEDLSEDEVREMLADQKNSKGNNR